MKKLMIIALFSLSLHQSIGARFKDMFSKYGYALGAGVTTIGTGLATYVANMEVSKQLQDQKDMIASLNSAVAQSQGAITGLSDAVAKSQSAIAGLSDAATKNQGLLVGLISAVGADKLALQDRHWFLKGKDFVYGWAGEIQTALAVVALAYSIMSKMSSLSEIKATNQVNSSKAAGHADVKDEQDYRQNEEMLARLRANLGYNPSTV